MGEQIVIWDKVLIVDDSRVYGQLMRTLMTPYCRTVLNAASAAEALAQIEAHPDLDLVLCDYVMEGGDGLEVLEAMQDFPEPKPQVLMVTGFPSESNAERAKELGAVDYLSKPTTIRRIIRSLETTSGGERRRINPRWRCAGQAHLLDAGEGFVIWDVYNISTDGAFLETKGPIAVGSELELRLQMGGRKADVRARVVRVQEPTWMDVGGVGVEFIEIDETAKDAILAIIEHGAPDA